MRIVLSQSCFAAVECTSGSAVGTNDPALVTDAAKSLWSLTFPAYP